MTTVLITGATGFIGGAATAHLLTTRPLRILALVRAPSTRDAEARLAVSLRRFGVSAADAAKVDVISGDLSELTTSDSRSCADVTHILHAAADTSFVSRRHVRIINTEQTVALARWARNLPRLERFLHIGTAWICGTSAPRLVSEDFAPRSTAAHVVEYTRSKADAEVQLEALRDLPLVVARPSIVVGHSQLGCRPSASIFWVFRAMDALWRTTWDLDGHIDVISVDYPAYALACLLLRPALAYRRYHISAGPVASCTWRDIGDAFARSDRLPSSRTRYSTTHQPVMDWPESWLAALRSSDVARVKCALQLYFQFAGSDTIFDNHRLTTEGIDQCAPFVDWIALCQESIRGRHIDDLINDDR